MLIIYVLLLLSLLALVGMPYERVVLGRILATRKIKRLYRRNGIIKLNG